MSRLNWNRARPQPRDADAVPSGRGVGPIHPIFERKRWINNLRYAGRCTACRRELRIGARALWDLRTHVLHCQRCAFSVIHENSTENRS